MPTLAEIRQQYPQYEDISDTELADKLHAKFYADLPKEDFDKKIGLQRVGSVVDFLKSIPRGALSGLMGAASAGGQAAQLEMGQPVDVPSAEQATKSLEQNVTGQLPRPQGRAGRYGATTGEFLGNPASYVGPAGLPMKALSAVTGALGSEYAGQASEGSKFEPYWRMAGAVAGGAAPQGLARLGAPLATSPERQAMVAGLRNEGIDALTAGQVTGNRPLRWMESVSADTPFGSKAATDLDLAAKEQFAQAASTRMGENATLTPETMNAVRDRLQQNFRDLETRNNFTYDQPFVNDLLQVRNRYDRVLPSQQGQAIDAYSVDIANQPGGVMPGRVYADTRSRLSQQSYAIRSTDPSFSQALRRLRDALDEGMGRLITPADKALWQQTKSQYGNMKRLEDAIGGATGELAPLGLLTPQRLKQSVSSGRRGDYARDAGPFDELARAGSTIMSPLPNSGTPARLGGMALMGSAGGLVGQLLGGHGGEGAAAGALAEPIARAAASRVVMNPMVQAILGNQTTAPLVLAGRERISPRLLRALAQTQTHRLLEQRQESRQ